MALYDIYSKRQKRLQGAVLEVYNYDTLPYPLVVQIIYIINDTVNENYLGPELMDYVLNNPTHMLRREYGVHKLVDKRYGQYDYEILSFLETAKDTDKTLYAIELIFRGIDTAVRDYREHAYVREGLLTPDDAIAELNARFKEHSIGYAYEAGRIIRVDSTYTHAEIIKPTLALLANSKFAGANDEYLRAHEHYRHGRNKECLTDCLKAFESTMKTICAEKGWEFDPAKDTATKLVQICFANNLVPAFMQSHITALKSVLENGITTVRNKLSGHGQGPVPRDVEDEVARYALNLTGSNIIFLVEQSGIV